MLRLIALFAAVLWGGYCSQATAEVLTATETVTASGILDGSPFTNALVTLTGTLNSSTFQVDTNHGFASVLLTGSPTVTVGGDSDTFTGRSLNPANGSQFNGGFELDSTGLTVTGSTYTGADVGFENVILMLSASDPAANYATALAGPGTVSGHAGISRGYQFFTTSGGFLELDSTSTNATFTIVATPEPGSQALFFLGAGGVARAARRKGRRANAPEEARGRGWEE